MKKNPWKCDKCGSPEVDQEWAFYAPMNEEGDEEQIISGAEAKDFYWCKICDEDCNPIQGESPDYD